MKNRLITSFILLAITALALFLTSCKRETEQSAQRTGAKSSSDIQTSLLKLLPEDTHLFLHLDPARLGNTVADNLRRFAKHRNEVVSEAIETKNTSAKIDDSILKLSTFVDFSRETLLALQFSKPQEPEISPVNLLFAQKPAKNEKISELKTKFRDFMISNGYTPALDAKSPEKDKVMKLIHDEIKLPLYLYELFGALILTSTKPELELPKAPLLNSDAYKLTIIENKVKADESVMLYVNCADILKVYEAELQSQINNENKVIYDVAKALSTISLVASPSNKPNAVNSRMLIGTKGEDLQLIKDLQNLKPFKTELAANKKTMFLLGLNTDFQNSKSLQAVQGGLGMAMAMFPQISKLSGLALRVDEPDTANQQQLIPTPNFLAELNFQDVISATMFVQSLKVMIQGIQCQNSKDQAGNDIEICPTPFGLQLANRIDKNKFFIGTEPALVQFGKAEVITKQIPEHAQSFFELYFNGQKLQKQIGEQLKSAPSPEVQKQLKLTNELSLASKENWLSISPDDHGFMVHSYTELLTDYQKKQ